MSFPVDPQALAAACLGAGELALEGWKRALASPVAFDSKGDGSPVTETDRSVEAHLRERLGALDPSIPVIGEEDGGDAGESDFAWVVDPIDGTRAFIAGIPTWTVSVGLLQEGRATLGCIVVPASREGRVFLGGDGLALTRDGRAVGTAPPESLRHEAVLVPSDVHYRYRLDFFCRTRSFGSSALHLALVSGGSALATLLHDSRVWDIAGGAALLAAAGGTLAHLDGRPLDLRAHLDGSQIMGPLLAGPAWAWELLAPRIEPQPWPPASPDGA